VMLLAVLLATIIGIRAIARKSSATSQLDVLGRWHGDSLQAALEAAEYVNAYKAGSGGDPSVHLKPLARIAPTGYQEGALEIGQRFNKGHVVCVDLGQISNEQATRLVDFCSGLLSGAPGWLFRASDTVIVLTPTAFNNSLARSGNLEG
jgi:hypothetical protein